MAANNGQTEPIEKSRSADDESEKLEETSTDGSSKAAEVQADHGLSKNQLKKQLKTQRWLEHKYQKRQDERAKKKMKRQQARERGDDLGPSRKALKQNRMADSSCQVKVVVDCSFDDLMKEREINSLVSQLNFCYASNRRAENPLQFYVTSCDGKTETRFLKLPDHKSWDVNFSKEHFDHVFDKDKIVYLSSDSENVLDKLVDDEIYVIGGLVDHNAHKGYCHNLAVEKGYRHAQLPIGKYMELKSRKVLAVNHVFDILLRFTETEDWEESFCKVIPKRKVNIGETESDKSANCDTNESSNEENIQDNNKDPCNEDHSSNDIDNQSSSEDDNS